MPRAPSRPSSIEQTAGVGKSFPTSEKICASRQVEDRRRNGCMLELQAGERPLSAPSFSGGVVALTDQFQDYARECTRLAGETTDPRLREQLVQMARRWTQLVTDAEEAASVTTPSGLPEAPA
jgi:hypothetical protein